MAVYPLKCGIVQVFHFQVVGTLMKGLSGKKVLVTGGTQGIGKSIATRFHEEGCQVTISGRRTSWHGEFNYLSVDFSHSISTKNFLNEVKKTDFDILVNNAGINEISPFLEIKESTFQTIQDVNLKGPFLTIQSALGSMLDKGWGRIVNIGSIFGVISKEFRSSYSASKFALDGLTASLSAEVASKGVLVNTVAPGFIETALTRSILSDKQVNELEAMVPLKRLGSPTEVAPLVAFLCSDENTFISGQCVIIDGGFTRV